MKHSEQHLILLRKAADNATEFFNSQKEGVKFCALVPGGWKQKDVILKNLQRLVKRFLKNMD